MGSNILQWVANIDLSHCSIWFDITFGVPNYLKLWINSLLYAVTMGNNILQWVTFITGGGGGGKFCFYFTVTL